MYLAINIILWNGVKLIHDSRDLLCDPSFLPGVSSNSVQLPGCPHITRRSEWGARPPQHAIGNMPATPIYVFIHHGTGGECFDKASCTAKVRADQNYHMDGHGEKAVYCRMLEASCRAKVRAYQNYHMDGHGEKAV